MCGIFGVINHHKRQLDKRAFITLGCANDSRGGDACGIMIDRKVDKGTEGNDQYFQCWYPKSKLLTETEKCYVALGHCRKASVGGVAADKAQPITIHDSEGNLLFCLIHNGTIYNYKELAEKYIPDVNIEGLTDSQVMARIFFYKGYDVLAEYNGGGAFVMHDYRNNKTLLFKGESKGSLSAVKTEVERPLYFVKTGKSVIFSSIYAVLQGLYWGFVAYDVPSNVLLECDGLNIYKVKEYDRTNCFGCKRYTVATTTSGTTYSGTYYNTSANYSTPNKVFFNLDTGTYMNSSPKEELHGIVYISRYGYISKYNTGFNHPYYFWKGIMLSGENSYTALRDLHAQKVSDKVLMNLARRLACHPVMINGRYFTYNTDNKKERFTDSFAFPLVTTEILCDSRGKAAIEYENEEIERFIPTNLTKEYINKIVDYVKKSVQ